LGTHSYLGNTIEVAESNKVQKKEKNEKVLKPPKEAKPQKKDSGNVSEKSKKRGRPKKVFDTAPEETKATSDEKEQDADSSTKP